MDIKEYCKHGYDLYSELANTVKDILFKVIQARNSDLELMKIQARAKEVKSLKTKIDNRQKCGEFIDLEHIEKDIKDLAGCRLVFYTNSAVQKFAYSNLIDELFTVDLDKSKEHFPVKKNDTSYVAHHYVVSLNDTRSSLPDYEKFAGLKCEIQIRTALNHAWAEITHDIIYKGHDFNQFGKTEFENIEQQANRIMDEWLIPAGCKFHKIEHDIAKLKEGKRLSDEGGLDQLQYCQNNDERYELLEKFLSLVLPQYEKLKVDQLTPEICQQLVSSLEAAKNSKDDTIKTTFGYIPGRSYIDVLIVALRILTTLPYSHIKKVFSTLCDLYTNRKGESESKYILEAVEQVTGYKYQVWEKSNLYVQTDICNQIIEMDNNQIEQLIPVITKALSTVLKVEMEDYMEDGATVNLQRRGVPHSNELVNLRATVFNQFEHVYSLATTDQERIDVFEPIWTRLRFKRPAGRNTQLEIMIFNDAIGV